VFSTARRGGEVVVVGFHGQPVGARAEPEAAGAVQVRSGELDALLDRLRDVRAAGQRHVDRDHQTAAALCARAPAAGGRGKRENRDEERPAHGG
jgi:hypothetical protein